MKVRRAWALPARVLAAAVVLASEPAAAGEVHGKPRIIDGDTLEVAGQRLRLYGIKAPAPDQVCRRAGQEYACGKVARAVLWTLVDGREVSCAPVAATEADGKVASICTAGDTSLNEDMVASGWALADPAGVVPYDQLERVAKTARRGLWTGEFDPPATWRRNAQ